MMALPTYFERNAEAAATLIQGFDPVFVAERLEVEVIGIIFDAAAAASTESRAALDMIVRLTARIYPTLAIVGLRAPSTYVAQLKRLAKSINPRIDLLDRMENATRIAVFGETQVPTVRKAVGSTWFVGSDNWFMRLSRNAPVGAGNSANPLAAGAASCVAAANVFRAIFATELGKDLLDDELWFSLLDMREVDSASANPQLTRLVLRDVHLAGAGAIGNGFLWALSRLTWRGTLHIVDPETITDSNLQRYVMAVASDRGKTKAIRSASWMPRAKGRTVESRVMDWATHISAQQHVADTVVSALDSARVRIEVQASLPRQVFNGWTQGGEAGVSRHRFLGTMACLACLYLPHGSALNEDQMVARALKLPDDEPTVRDIRQRLQQNKPTERAYLERIAAASGAPIGKLLAYENQPLSSLYVGGVCGGAIMEFHAAALDAHADVPMAFQSAFAGIALAAELARPTRLPHTVTQIDLLGTFPPRPGRNQEKSTTPPCICVDEDFIDVYRAKYPTETVGS